MKIEYYSSTLIAFDFLTYMLNLNLWNIIIIHKGITISQGGKGETPVLQYSTVLHVLHLYSTCTPLVLHCTPLVLHPYSGVLESRLFPLAISPNGLHEFRPADFSSQTFGPARKSGIFRAILKSETGLSDRTLK